MDSCAPGCASPRLKTHAARVNVTGDWGNEDETASTLGGILSIAELTSTASCTWAAGMSPRGAKHAQYSCQSVCRPGGERWIILRNPSSLLSPS